MMMDMDECDTETAVFLHSSGMVDGLSFKKALRAITRSRATTTRGVARRPSSSTAILIKYSWCSCPSKAHMDLPRSPDVHVFLARYPALTGTALFYAHKAVCRYCLFYLLAVLRKNMMPSLVASTTVVILTSADGEEAFHAVRIPLF